MLFAPPAATTYLSFVLVGNVVACHTMPSLAAGRELCVGNNQGHGFKHMPDATSSATLSSCKTSSSLEHLFSSLLRESSMVFQLVWAIPVAVALSTSCQSTAADMHSMSAFTRADLTYIDAACPLKRPARACVAAQVHAGMSKQQSDKVLTADHRASDYTMKTYGAALPACIVPQLYALLARE